MTNTSEIGPGGLNKVEIVKGCGRVRGMGINGVSATGTSPRQQSQRRDGSSRASRDAHVYPVMKSKLFLAGLVLASCAWAAAQPAAPKAASSPAAAETDEKPAGTKAEQLAAAQKQLAILKLRHDEKHPVVLKQRAKVVRLQQEVSAERPRAGKTSKADELAAAKQELEELRKKYTDQHPSVKALTRRIGELERGQ